MNVHETAFLFFFLNSQSPFTSTSLDDVVGAVVLEGKRKNVKIKSFQFHLKKMRKNVFVLDVKKDFFIFLTES